MSGKSGSMKKEIDTMTQNQTEMKNKIFDIKNTLKGYMGEKTRWQHR